jgi:raffinose/stachyose/melibiose transport system substrate-binding protein
VQQDNPLGLSRRSMMKALGLGAAAIAGPGLVAGCSSSSSGGRTSSVFEETKPEVVPYFNNLVAKFNASQSQLVVTHDFRSSLIAEFVRGNPPAIDCDNYNLTTSIFVARGASTSSTTRASSASHPAAGRPRSSTRARPSNRTR